jgi:FAD/FMN-containing dehydrogenase
MKQFLYTLINIILYAGSFGKYIWLEGRFKNGVYRNWSRVLAYKPKKYLTPATEEEIIQIIKESEKIRVVGAGHSFNRGAVSDEVLVSLDKYSGIVWKDLNEKRVCVKGGTRVRDISEILWKKYNLALIALPSHDAQSIAGILATDVHGTGREYGFVNQSVLKIKLIDGRGEVCRVHPW